MNVKTYIIIAIFILWSVKRVICNLDDFIDTKSPNWAYNLPNIPSFLACIFLAFLFYGLTPAIFCCCLYIFFC